MKTVFLGFLVLTAICSQASATELYVEGNLGFHSADVATKTYSISTPDFTATNLKMDLDYDIDPGLGFEVGVKVSDKISAGVSFSQFNANFKDASITGTVSDGFTTYTGPLNISHEQLDLVGIDFDTKATLVMLNGYYSFDTIKSIQPFVGAGIGMAHLSNAKDNEPALSAIAGAKYLIDDNKYVGAKLAYTQIAAPTDRLGTQYDNIGVMSAYLMVGMSF
jgi:opacity protein-like surface antigen